MSNKKLTTVASTSLIIYAFYKIIQTLLTFNRTYYPLTPLGEKLLYYFSIDSWSLLTLGICGLLFVCADLSKDKNIDFQNRLANIKKIIYTAYTAFSIGLIFRFVYMNYTSYQSLVMFSATGGEIAGSKRYFINLVFLSVLGILIILGRILFGIYLLTKKEKLVKPLLIIYFTGLSYTFISRTINFINAVISNNEIFSDAFKVASLGNPQNRIDSIILSFVVDILVLAAGLIIVMYGIKKEDVKSANLAS